MKRIIKNIFYFTIPVLIMVYFIFSYNVIKNDFRTAHQSSLVYNPSFSWSKYIMLGSIKKFYIKFFNYKGTYIIPKREIFVEEQSLKRLLESTPNSTKKWVSGYFKNSKDKFQSIQMRYRGDNPRNWLLEKKSFKIKTKRDELINNVRDYDYWNFSSEIYAAHRLFYDLGFVSQEPKIVVVNLNGEHKGVYIELERINEKFLRNKKIMPVNVYKGENASIEKPIGINSNLFNNPYLWNKLSVFRDVNDKSDLAYFLKTLKENELEKIPDPTINGYIDVKNFSKFLAFLTITQNNHHDWYHNMRLIVDPWNGKVTQIITDPIIGDEVQFQDKRMNEFLIDFSSNDLTSYLTRSSIVNNEKYKWLYKYIIEKNQISKISKYYDSIEQNLSYLDKIEPYQMYGRHTGQKPTTDFKNTINELKSNEVNIKKILTDKPDVNWNDNKKNFSIIVKSILPASDIEVYFNDEKNIPNWISIDENYDNKISDSEEKFYINKNNLFISIPVSLYANRENNTYSDSNFKNGYKVTIAPTKFKFITSNSIMPNKIVIKNNFSGKKNVVVKKNTKAVKANKFNKIINLSAEKLEKEINLSGEIIVNENIVFDNQVNIEPGTTFLINKGKHIIFKNKVLGLGDKINPIIFKPLKNDDMNPWGTVAILGEKTSGSILRNVNMSGGSGGKYNQFMFISMFSIHDAQNIKIEESEFSNNKIYDDNIHVIYSKKIELKNNKILNSLRDAIDIDMSEDIYIDNLQIENSGNDGIDFMETSAVINSGKIINSKDKGISIGENSSVNINKIILKDNKTGIAVKDSSEAEVENSTFNNNKIQVSSYAKNWRYGSGGAIKIKNSKFQNNINNFYTKRDPEVKKSNIQKDLVQNSEILIESSEFQGDIKSEGDKIFIN